MEIDASKTIKIESEENLCKTGKQYLRKCKVYFIAFHAPNASPGGAYKEYLLAMLQEQLLATLGCTLPFLPGNIRGGGPRSV